MVGLVSSRKWHSGVLLVDLLKSSCMLVDTGALTALHHAEVLGMLASTVCCRLRLRLGCLPTMDLSFFLLSLNACTVNNLVIRHQGVELLLYNCGVVQILSRPRHGASKLILRVHHASNVNSGVSHLDIVRHCQSFTQGHGSHILSTGSVL